VGRIRGKDEGKMEVGQLKGGTESDGKRGKGIYKASKEEQRK
jgi:hypothetical protein